MGHLHSIVLRLLESKITPVWRRKHEQGLTPDGERCGSPFLWEAASGQWWRRVVDEGAGAQDHLAWVV